MTDTTSTPEAQVRRRRKIATLKSHYRPLPTREELSKWLRYCPETGKLYRIARRKGGPGAQNELIALAIPREIGRPTREGYLVIKLLDQTNVLVSRVAWKIQTGEDPGDKQVDHVNGNVADNRWLNLRLADTRQNSSNRRKPKVEAWSKYKGVSFRRDRSGKIAYIRASIMVHGKTIHLGHFPAEEAAYAAYCEAARKYHGEFARLE